MVVPSMRSSLDTLLLHRASLDISPDTGQLQGISRCRACDGLKERERMREKKRGKKRVRERKKREKEKEGKRKKSEKGKE